MNELLKALGITASNAQGYHEQFGIVLNSRSIQPIESGPQNLTVGSSDQQRLVDQIAQSLDFDFTGVDMFFLDAPIVEAPTVIQVAAAPRKENDIYLTLGSCKLHPTAEQMRPEYYREGYRALNPQLTADAFFFRDIRQSELALDEALVDLIRPPQHGKLSKPRMVPGVGQLFSYYPDKGFRGNDRVEFLLTNKDGLKVRVIHFIKVDPKYDSHIYPNVDMYPKYCPMPPTWEISQSKEIGSDSTDLASWIRSTSLATFLTDAQSALIGLVDLKR
jgi:hypothetical protein